MKNTIVTIAILLIFALTGCSKNESPKIEKKESKDTGGTVKEFKKEGAGAETKEKPSDGITDLKYDVKDIQDKLKYDGNIVAGAQWKDKNGLNAVIVTETKESEKIVGENRDRELSKKLFGYGFVFTEDGSSQEIWKIQDLVEKCVFDLTLEFIKNSLTVTDLNENGIAETTFLYKMTCRSDVSPCDLKLMMHEGKEKYAIRGEMIIKLPNEGPYGGKTNVDKSFDKAPKEFLDYAKKEWKKFQEEKFQ